MQREERKKVNFDARRQQARQFVQTGRLLAGHVPTIAITPVADGRVGAYESNVDGTWRMVERVYERLTSKVKLPDGEYLDSMESLESMLGKRATKNLLHPVTGQVLIAEGQIVSKFVLKKLENSNFRPWDAAQR